MLADGGEVTADLALQRDQAEVFGTVASTPTAWRLLAGIDSAALARLRSARTTARDLPGLVLDLDATLVTSRRQGSFRGDVACGRGRRTVAAGGAPKLSGPPPSLHGW